MNSKQRHQNKQTANKLKNSLPPTTPCPKCGVLTNDGHYIPSSFQEPGFWICGQEGIDKITPFKQSNVPCIVVD